MIALLLTCVGHVIHHVLCLLIAEGILAGLKWWYGKCHG